MQYITKYVTKSETSSIMLRALIKELSNKVDSNTSSKSIVMRAMHKVIGQRDISSQEVFHLLMSNELCRSSEQVVNVSLNYNRKLKKQTERDNADGSDSVVEPNILDNYGDRLHLNNQHNDTDKMNLIEFVQHYKIRNGKLEKRPKQVIPRTFPTYSSNQSSSNYHLYCKYALIKYKPWIGNYGDSFNEEDTSFYVRKWEQFVRSDIGRSKVPEYKRCIVNSEIQNEISQSSSSQDSESINMSQEDWMNLLEIDNELTYDIPKTN